MELQIDRTPLARGVTHLMYVGDDEAVEKALAPAVGRTELVATGVAAVLAVAGTGIVRTGARVAVAIQAVRAIRALARR